MILPSWFLFTVASVLFLTLAESMQKVAMDDKQNISSQTQNFFVVLFFLPLSTILAISTGALDSLIFSPKFLLLWLIGGVLSYFSGRLYYQSYKGNSIGISIILQSISVVTSTAIGILFLRESQSIEKFLGIALVLLAIVLVNFNRDEKFTRYNIAALAGGVGFGISYSIDGKLVAQSNPIGFIFLVGIMFLAISLIFSGRTIAQEAKRLKPRNVAIMFFASLGFFAYNLLSFFAYEQDGDVGIVDAINNASIFLLFAVEYFIFREKGNMVKKIVAGITAFGGVLLLSQV